MKSGIHPTFYEDALVVCACGNTWHTGSTKKEIHTDVCNKCHPFYTGEQRIVDTAGQVERFMKRVTAHEQLAVKPEEAKPSKKERRARVRQVRSGMPEAVTESETSAPEASADSSAVVAEVPVAADVAPAKARRPRKPRAEKASAVSAEQSSEPVAEPPNEPSAENSTSETV